MFQKNSPPRIRKNPSSPARDSVWFAMAQMPICMASTCRPSQSTLRIFMSRVNLGRGEPFPKWKQFDALVVLVLLTAESEPGNKDLMIRLVMNLIAG